MTALEELMGNGKSGGFGISKERLQQILDALPADAVVARAGTSRKVQPSAVGLPSIEIKVSAMRQTVSEYPEDVFPVEEQDYSWYILHLEPIHVEPPTIEKWVIVRSNSPLFEELRRCHRESTKPRTNTSVSTVPRWSRLGMTVVKMVLGPCQRWDNPWTLDRLFP
jgi:hypothetical protein